MTATTSNPPPLTVGDLAGEPGRRRKEQAVRAGLTAAAGLSILISLTIVFVLLRDAIGFIAALDGLGELTANIWRPRSGRFGVLSPIVGTLYVTVIATAVAGPIGLGAAIYLSEYAKPRARRIVKPIIEVLASIPSVVVGYFAFRFIAPEITQRIFSDSPSKNLLVAGLGVGLLTIPLMTSVSEDALRAVPGNLREASYGLGAKKITTVTRVVVPAAVSGLVAGLILSVSRAIGETLVVTLAAGGNGILPGGPLDPGITVTSAMTNVAIGSDQASGGAVEKSIFFLGLMLFVLTLLLNLVADRFVRRVRQTY